jgi:septal ring factor EnvC (AmiA/AmiB activator)
LPLPARGRIVQRYGQHTDFGTLAKGITIETLPRAQVIAPHDGRVVFAGVYRDYGQLLIIEHGEGYHTLLAGFSRIDGTVGQWLLAGEPIGQMGAGSTGKPVLYVELRRNGEPMNPLPWLAAKERRVSG